MATDALNALRQLLFIALNALRENADGAFSVPVAQIFGRLRQYGVGILAPDGFTVIRPRGDRACKKRVHNQRRNTVSAQGCDRFAVQEQGRGKRLAVGGEGPLYGLL